MTVDHAAEAAKLGPRVAAAEWAAKAAPSPAQRLLLKRRADVLRRDLLAHRWMGTPLLDPDAASAVGHRALAYIANHVAVHGHEPDAFELLAGVLLMPADEIRDMYRAMEAADHA